MLRRSWCYVPFSIIAFLVAGCGPNRVVVQPPEPPTLSEVKNVPFIAPLTNEVKYVEKNGKGEQAIDNVTVKVISITGDLPEQDFTVAIKGPGDKTYEYSIFPHMLVLKITNNTDHIVTLDRTIVRLEDDNQREYPMITTTAENKVNLIKRVSKVYDEYIQNYKKTYCEQYKESIYGDYKTKYDESIAEINKAKSEGADVVVPMQHKGTVTFVENGKRTERYVNELMPMVPSSYIRQRSPETLFNQCNSIADKKLQEQKIAVLKSDAIRKISEDIPDQMKGVITSGVYPRIDILPGRMARVVAPFSKRNEKETINLINVGVYDLPTKVDSAANPTKRANFNFQMVAEAMN